MRQINEEEKMKPPIQEPGSPKPPIGEPPNK